MSQMHAVEDQGDVFTFLTDPATHGLDQPVIRIDTHGACVFLAGPDVYKVKRAIRYPFMDFSTLEKRRLACENEIAVNKMYAPSIYLGAVPITRDDGALRIGGQGKIVEWAVHLRRFDENSTLDRLAERGELGPDLIPELATMVLESHRRAPVSSGEAATAALKAQAGDTLNELARGSDIFPPEQICKFQDAITSQLAALEPLLLRRAERGQVRRCHGDLHLRNIVLIEKRPVLFDAIEFDETIATCDILYDLAFLIMDLWERRLRREANLLLNRYLWGCDDEDLQLEGLAALPVFLSLRAAIRAKVAAELARLSPSDRGTAEADARRYFSAASSFISAHSLHLIGIGGLSGTGKSTLAALLAPAIGRPPGAVHLRSDIERKRHFGIGELEPLPAADYAPEISQNIYRRLRQLAGIALQAKSSVLVDAVHLREEERDALTQVARDTGASFVGFWLDAPVKVLHARVATRSGDASDATPKIVSAQAEQSIGNLAWHRLDASEAPDTLVRRTLGCARVAAQS
jgi:uncharacterized protein